MPPDLSNIKKEYDYHIVDNHCSPSQIKIRGIQRPLDPQGGILLRQHGFHSNDQKVLSRKQINELL